METTIMPGLDFIKKVGPGLTTMLVDKLNPRYCDGDPVRELSLTKPLFDAQAVRVEALGRQLAEERTALLVGEMGVGKTLMGTATARWLYLDHLKKGSQQHLKVLITCPPTLVSTWQEEIKATLPAGSYRFVNFLRHAVPEQGRCTLAARRCTRPRRWACFAAERAALRTLRALLALLGAAAALILSVPAAATTLRAVDWTPTEIGAAPAEDAQW